MGRRRAFVLGAVHVLILAHISHWLVTGRTLSPVEPSEAMQTLELGRVNPGFLFFALAIASTALLGRFFCGWGCHVVALQDLCTWIMRRMGIRPRPFRSRLLAWAPLGLALYMFVWPTLRRAVLVPALGRFMPSMASLLGARAPFPGFRLELTTEHFWEGFPGLGIALALFGICGFAAVYLLGSKGFCTYGCPYGAFFGSVEAVAPGRIRVTEACRQSGQCTLACTSNVRVHEEIREFGMVVNPGCMKCMDCVSSCPNGALYFGFGPPAIRRARRRANSGRRAGDLRRGEEIGIASVFLATLLAFRGVYDAVPLLMSVGIAGCFAFLAWIAYQLGRRRQVHLQNLALKREGKLRPGGLGVLALTGAAFLLTLQSGFVRIHRARAAFWDRQITATRHQVLSVPHSPLPERTVRMAEAAEEHYRRADAWSAEGFGLVSTPGVVVRRAWLALVRDRPQEAEIHLRRLLDLRGPARPVRRDLARVLLLTGQRGEAQELLGQLIAEDPADADAHRLLAGALEEEGKLESVLSELIILKNLRPGDRAIRARLAELLERLGRPEEASRYRD